MAKLNRFWLFIYLFILHCHAVLFGSLLIQKEKTSLEQPDHELIKRTVEISAITQHTYRPVSCLHTVVLRQALHWVLQLFLSSLHLASLLTLLHLSLGHLSTTPVCWLRAPGISSSDWPVSFS